MPVIKVTIDACPMQEELADMLQVRLAGVVDCDFVQEADVETYISAYEEIAHQNSSLVLFVLKGDK